MTRARSRAKTPPVAAPGHGTRAGAATRGDAGRGPRVPWTWVALVVALACAVYANTIGGILLYDDVNAIRDNAFVRDADVAGILTRPSWWADGRGGLWRPLSTLMFAAEHGLWGLDPVGYHVVNVVVHALVSVLVLVVFARVTAAPRTALAAAMLFATHPIHTEAVANVVGRAELLAAAGFLLAWRAWLAADAAAPGRAAPWLAAAVAAYFLAMCAKENAIALPAVLLLADLVGRRAAPAEPGARVAALVRRRAPRYAALLATAAAFVAVRSAVIGRVTPPTDLLDNPLSALAAVPRLLTAVAVLGLYALRLVFPLWLSADYSYDQIAAVTSPLDFRFLAAVAVLGSAGALAWRARRRAPAVTLGLGILALTFAVVSNLCFTIGTIMGERLAYLPSAGFCLALAAGLVRLGGHAAPGGEPGARAAPRWSPVFLGALGTIVALYGVRTVERNDVWLDPIRFYETMAADAPRSARSHRELGTALADRGRFAEARAAFDRSLAIKPDDASTLYNLGNALGAEGRFAAAADAYRRAIAENPSFTRAYENLGNAESMRGDQQAALAALRRALELAPDSPITLMNLANTYVRAGAPVEARATYERALALAPTSPEILTNYGTLLYAQADYVGAVRAFERIPSPPPARALVALAGSYRLLGRAAEARATQAAAERLYPRDPAVRQYADFVAREAAKDAPP
ncbi:MAG: tetratricopeptide repeat protein [Deltaproteobacteria bacterium]|nr:tetratricopeptide repeat protein [Deltaproteobacteria bacterium]